MDIAKIFENVLLGFTGAVPKLIGAVLLFVVGWLVAKIVSAALRKALEVTKIDAFAEKLKDLDFLSGFTLKPSVMLSQVVFYILLLFFISAVSETLGMAVVSNQVASLINYIPKLLSAVVVFLGGALLANLLKEAVGTAAKSLNIPSSGLIANIVFYFLLISIAISALEQAGMNTDFIKNNLTLILGGVVFAFALAYGYASRDTLTNLLSASYSRNRFFVGDEIEVGHLRGTIIDIDSAAVTLRDTAGKTVVLPQRLLTQTEVTIHQRAQKLLQ